MARLQYYRPERHINFETAFSWLTFVLIVFKGFEYIFHEKCKWSQLLLKTAWESYEALFIAHELNWVKEAFSKSTTYSANFIQGLSFFL